MTSSASSPPCTGVSEECVRIFFKILYALHLTLSYFQFHFSPWIILQRNTRGFGKMAEMSSHYCMPCASLPLSSTLLSLYLPCIFSAKEIKGISEEILNFFFPTILYVLRFYILVLPICFRFMFTFVASLCVPPRNMVSFVEDFRNSNTYLGGHTGCV